MNLISFEDIVHRPRYAKIHVCLFAAYLLKGGSGFMGA